MAVALAVPVGTARAVLSSSGVVEYVSWSPWNATLVKGSCESATEEALAKASLSGAFAEGLREARSNSPGLRTL